jgi:hypothetical protein
LTTFGYFSRTDTAKHRAEIDSPTATWGVFPLEHSNGIESLFPCKRINRDGTSWTKANHGDTFNGHFLSFHDARDLQSRKFDAGV